MEPALPTAALQKKICMIGGFSVGKTSLVRRFVESIFDERYQTTIGVKIDRKRVAVRGQTVNLIVWDLAGDDDLEQLRMSHLRGASGYILVADGCRSATLDQALSLHERITSVLGPTPFVVALNKEDLADEWEIGDRETNGVAQHGWTIFRTSARTGHNVENLFLTLAEKMLKEAAEQAWG